MDEVTFVLAICCWGLLPGLALVSALRLEWTGAERVAGAAGLSLAVVAAAAYLAELIGLPVSPLAVAVVVAAACAAFGAVFGVTSRAAFGASRPAAICPPDPESARFPASGWFPVPTPRWAPWLVLLLPLVVFDQLEPVRSARLLLPPTLDDGLDHAMWFRLILETRSVSPAEVLAPPLNPDGSATYYPWGLHAWLALVAGTTTLDPIVVFFRGLIAVSGMLPLSVYVFAAHVAGRGWPALTAAALSLLFWWLPYQAWGWGGYALLGGAVAALPVARLSLEAVRAGRVAPVLAAALAGAGVLLVHPSQALAALLICATTSVTLAAGRAGAWRHAVPFVLALAGAGAAMALGARAAEPIAAFMDRASTVGASLSGDPRYDWPVSVYANAIWQTDPGGRVALAVLYVVGFVVSLRHAALRPIAVLHVVFSLMIPLAAAQTWLTSLWYHSPERLWYLQYATLPLLGAFGVAGLLQLLDLATRRRLALRRKQVWLWPIAGLAFLFAIHDAYADRASIWLWRYAHNSRPMPVNDARMLADFAWMRGHIPPDAVLFNASGDWGLSLPFTGHRTVFWSGGYAIDPATNWHLLQDLMSRGDPYTSHAVQEARALGLEFVYAARVDGRLETSGRKGFEVSRLGRAAALERLYASPTAEVFRLRADGSRALGLAESDTLHFVDGFWGAEQSNARSWRWTNGRGRFRITPDAPPVRACYVRLFGPDPAAYSLEIDGVPLELTTLGHRVPPREPDAASFEIDVISPAVSPAQSDPGHDDRRLGVQVFDITLQCPVAPAG